MGEKMTYQKKIKENIKKLINQNMLAEAEDLLNQYASIVDNDVEIYSMKAVIAMILGEKDKAEKALERGLILDNQNFDILYNLGYLYQASGENELAYHYYQTALKNADDEEKADEVLKIIASLGIEEKENKEQAAKNDIKITKRKKLKIVFFPYKITMWDSLETVYEAFAKDENCEVRVVPIPYYQLTQDKDKAIPMYEGDRFPARIPICHYSKYDIKKEKPDIVFLHNIYDQYNTLTRVYPEYFTANIRKYAKMLIYVPYHIPPLFYPYGRNTTYMIPTLKYVDKVIVIGDFVKKAAIKDGIPESKVLSLGSPKIDSMVNSLKHKVSVPSEWEEKIKDKTVYVLDTGCLYFANDPFSRIEEITNIFNITNLYKDTVLIWRPHPLTKASIIRYVPQLLNYYNELIEHNIKAENKFYNNVILDETDDYKSALSVSDALISTGGSLIGAYLLTGKKIIFLDKEMPKGTVVPSDTFYYFYNKKESWYKLIERLNAGDDPLAEKRKGLAGKIYKNPDGTCGEKIYQAIKELYLSTL
ncbi:MAG: hypothetical protein GX922_01835 [Firmicutes bacterium]|nr:hypothetical protein [Bacillota bacterium]